MNTMVEFLYRDASNYKTWNKVIVKGKNDNTVTWPYAARNVETYWDAVAYNSYWNDAMFLEPFPQTEINKGTLVQNPGY